MNDWHLPRGFRFAGSHCGIKDASRKDLALIFTEVPASAAGVFTRNQVRAAPVRLCQQRLPTASARAVVICSGNANACTGQRGLDDARRMAATTAEALGCREEQVLVASTGIIGQPLPMERIEPGIRALADQLEASPQGLEHAAQGILTTDTRIKVVTRQIEANGGTIHLTGLAKGAAMIGPNMATMLAFVCTDAAITPEDLGRLVTRASEYSFHCVSVEGHTSTNDTLLVLANGQATPHAPSPLKGEALARFASELEHVCANLARAIAEDAEGAKHLITIEVEGLRDQQEAWRVAKTVADSALVKTAIFGADPNWGRIVSAAGYAGVAFEENDLSLWLGDVLLYRAGTPQPFDARTASAYLKRERNIHLRLHFTLGSGRCTFWTCDLTYEYVRLNAEYTT
jgi:glutamate N-acetyltransferase/amino-acid N-acetyltransferase